MADHQILQLIESGKLEQAYREIQAQISAASLTPDVLALSRRLSAEIRSRCMGLSSNKATDGSPEVFRLEALLRKVIQITGEGIYG